MLCISAERTVKSIKAVCVYVSVCVLTRVAQIITAKRRDLYNHARTHRTLSHLLMNSDHKLKTSSSAIADKRPCNCSVVSFDQKWKTIFCRRDR